MKIIKNLILFIFIFWMLSITSYKQNIINNYSFWFKIQDFYSMYDEDWNKSKKWEIYQSCSLYTKEEIKKINEKKDKTEIEKYKNNCWIMNSANWLVNFILTIAFLYFFVVFIIKFIFNPEEKTNLWGIDVTSAVHQNNSIKFKLLKLVYTKEFKYIMILFFIASWMIPVFIDIVKIIIDYFFSWLDFWFSSTTNKIYDQFHHWIMR